MDDLQLAITTGVDEHALLDGADAVDVRFTVTAAGARLWGPGDDPGGDGRESWTSEAMRYETGAGPLPAADLEVLAPAAGPVRLELTLSTSGSFAAHQVLPLTAIGRPDRMPARAVIAGGALAASGASAVLQVRETSSSTCSIHVMSGARYDEVEADDALGDLQAAMTLWREELEKRSRAYTPGGAAAGDDAGLALAADDDVLLGFARIGSALYESLFGEPDVEENPGKLTRAARTLAVLGDPALYETARRAVHIVPDPPHRARVELIEIP